jgi:predicted PurR-regulated permease PerM
MELTPETQKTLIKGGKIILALYIVAAIVVFTFMGVIGYFVIQGFSTTMDQMDQGSDRMQESRDRQQQMHQDNLERMDEMQESWSRGL